MPFDPHDTIVAIATPPGRGGIGVVRLSGPDAHAIARALITHRDPLQPRHATLTKVRLPASALRASAWSRRSAAPDMRREGGKPDTTYEKSTHAADSHANAESEVVSGVSRTSAAIDQAIVTYFPAPGSYTGDDVVELSAHG